MGLQGSQFPGEDDVMREIRDLKRTVQQLAAANQLAAAGIRAVAGGIIVEGSQSVNGPMSINGPLTLQPGSIENDSLTDPVVLSTSGISQSGFIIPAAGAVYASATVTVPEGYTKADVICMVVGGGVNSTANPDYIYISSSINGVYGGSTPQFAAAGGYGSAAANGIRSMTGLVAGSSITLGCRVRGGSADWDANAANFANMNAFIYFRR